MIVNTSHLNYNGFCFVALLRNSWFAFAFDLPLHVQIVQLPAASIMRQPMSALYIILTRPQILWHQERRPVPGSSFSWATMEGMAKTHFFKDDFMSLNDIKGLVGLPFCTFSLGSSMPLRNVPFLIEAPLAYLSVFRISGIAP